MFSSQATDCLSYRVGTGQLLRRTAMAAGLSAASVKTPSSPVTSNALFVKGWMLQRTIWHPKASSVCRRLSNLVKLELVMISIFLKLRMTLQSERSAVISITAWSSPFICGSRSSVKAIISLARFSTFTVFLNKPVTRFCGQLSLYAVSA